MVGKFAKGIFTGLGAPKRGMSFLGEHPKLISWCVIPVIINYLIFGTLAYLAGKFIPELSDMILPEATNWFWDVVRFLLQGVGYLIVGVAAYFLFVPVAGLIASPFNDMLAEQVGILKTGEVPEGAGWKNFASDALFSIGVEAKKLLLLVILAVGTFLVGLIPVVQVISPVVGVLVGIFYVALEYIDFAMAHRKLPFSDRVAMLAADQPGMALGFGLPPYVVALVPVVNVLVIPLLAPVMVVAGALLYYEHLAPGHEAVAEVAN
ncbi:MAG: EI24 domain-containing protein [Chrysiogenetes bacterium]|nr:EI24 domain-containing protein [Chrysiogenetes bacterium]